MIASGERPNRCGSCWALLSLGLAAYLSVVFLPSRMPLSETERAELSQHAGVDEDAWRFSPDLYEGAMLAVALIGFVWLIHRCSRGNVSARREIRCRRCKTKVFAEPVGFGYQCQAGHSASTAYGKIVLLLLFLMASVCLGALIVVASLG